MTMKKRLAAMLLAGVMAASAVPATVVGAAAEALETTEIEVDYLASSKKVTIAGREYETTTTQLSLYGENLTKTDLKNIGKLTKLTWLKLESCHLSNLSFLKGLTNLEELYLADNEDIQKLAPIKNLTKLKILDLSCTGVLSLSELKNMKKLEELRLIGMKNNIKLSGLKNLTGLKRLSLSGGAVKKLPSLKNLKKLESLDLSDSSISSLSLSGLPKLQALSLVGCKSLSSVSLSGLTKLEYLNLWDCSKLPNISFSDFPNLVELNLAGTGITDFTSLKNLKNLKKLIIPCSDNIDIKSLKEISSLEILNLGNPNFSSSNSSLDDIYKYYEKNLEKVKKEIPFAELWVYNQ